MRNIESHNLGVIRHARDIAAAYYLSNPRVTLIDIGWKIEDGVTTDKLAVRVHVRNKPQSGAEFETYQANNPRLIIDKDRIPIPDKNVDIVEATYPLHWYGYFPQVNPRGRFFDPLCGGISISNAWSYSYGTLGGFVKDRSSGDDLILSNWHVLAGTAYARRGLAIYQPGYGDGGRRSHTIAYLERHAMNQNFDAAVARFNNARSWNNNQIDVGLVSGVTSPMIGMRVIKSGRGSQVTEGRIDGFDGDYPIWYGGFPRKIKNVYRIVPSVPTDQVSRGGDSGSWWLEESTMKAVALHFAGKDFPETALAMSMPQVLEALNVDIVTDVEPARVVTESRRVLEPVRV